MATSSSAGTAGTRRAPPGATACSRGASARAGTAAGTEFQVNTYTISEQFITTVAADDGGAFVDRLAELPATAAAHGIFGRRFSSAGAPLAVEFQVGQRTSLQQIRASIDVASGGAFMVAWTDSASRR